MSASEFFERARADQRAIDAQLAVLDSMRSREAVRAQRYDRAGGAPTGLPDAMRATDERIDAEGAVGAELARMAASVEDARAVCRGVRAANPLHRWADALELRYCEDMPWRAVACALGVSERQAQAEARAGLEWCDLVGLDAAREGRGQVALF